jgi:glycerol-3-phosphate dehydrogenase
MPAYRWWEPAFYGFGLGLYDRLAGREALGATRRLNRAQTLSVLPGARGEGLCGGVLYWDGQFEDARLALALARTAAARGALVLNHVAASGMIYEEWRIAGVACEDCESGTRYEVHARAVVNATGVWVDALRTADGVSTGQSTTPIVAPSQGVHLVVDRSFLPGERALLVPSTRDGRVLFAVPWLGRTLLGTTDTPREDIVREPLPFSAELDFILGEAGRYLARAPGRADVTSAWVGLRPLVRTDPADCGDTKRLSREHTVTVSRAGLVTVTGGKWTTYRAMAEDVLERCFESALLARRPAGVTRTLTLVGGDGDPTANRPIALEPGAHLYGSEAAFLGTLPGADRPLGGGLTEAMVRFAARHEYARTVEDVLARRSRLLFLDARLAGALAPEVARLLYEETGHDPDLAGFSTLVQRYAVLPEPV